MRNQPLAGPIVIIASLAACASRSAAQSYDFDWATIGDPGNAAYDDPYDGLLEGRGSVPYRYRISRLETTTAQWMEFVNTFSTQSDDLAFFGRPSFWGATIDTSYDGPGRRYRLKSVDSAAFIPVHGIDWREAAMFCNWLHNGKSSDMSAIEDGAYDASTFTLNDDGTFNDQATHHPDARFWIPTLDEWAKAAHYDPDRHGPGRGGWWSYPDRSEDPLVPGLPGEGDTSATLSFDGELIPLGAYPHAASPWGLLDLSGATMEWTEEVDFDHKSRWADGAPLYAESDWLLVDTIDQMSPMRPWIGGSWMGIRIVTVVPTPGVAGPLVLLSAYAGRRKRP